VVLSNGQNKLEIVENGNWESKFAYHHKHAVTSVAVYQSSLLVGDERGKITQLVDFLIEGKARLTQKLQWHVHAVNSLLVEGSYLYSSGEEGVVVVWHLRENKKDFLPRIGSEIGKLVLDGATLYCMLSDNTIKSIDFSNDKAVLQYKVVVSPLMHHIDASSLQLARNNLVRVSPLADRLWMRSQPGRIQ
jgi:WD40 repeat protein